MANDLKEIFEKLKKLAAPYEKKFTVRLNSDKAYDMWSEKNVFAFGKNRKEVYFIGLIIQSNYVGFYFMPVYSDPGLKKMLHPDLLALMKGKSCFHIKLLDKSLELHIKNALKTGYDYYKNLGWV